MSCLITADGAITAEGRVTSKANEQNYEMGLLLLDVHLSHVTFYPTKRTICQQTGSGLTLQCCGAGSKMFANAHISFSACCVLPKQDASPAVWLYSYTPKPHVNSV